MEFGEAFSFRPFCEAKDFSAKDDFFTVSLALGMIRFSPYFGGNSWGKKRGDDSLGRNLRPGIRNTLFGLFLLFSLVPLLFMGVLFWSRGGEFNEQRAVEEEAATAKVVAGILERRIEFLETRLHDAVRLTSLQSLKKNEQEQILANIFALHSDVVSSLVCFNKKGLVTAQFPLNSTKAKHSNEYNLSLRLPDVVGNNETTPVLVRVMCRVDILFRLPSDILQNYSFDTISIGDASGQFFMPVGEYGQVPSESETGTTGQMAVPALDAKKKYVSANVFFLFGDNRFIVRVDRPLATFQMQEACWPVWSALVLMIFFAGFMSYFFAKRILKPLHSIANTVRSISMGDVQQRVHVDSHDEFADVALSMNTMLDKQAFTLKGLYEHVDRLIRERDDILRSEKFYRQITENIEDVLFVINLDFHLSYVSSSAQRVLGLSSKKILNEAFDALLTPDSFRQVNQVIHDMLAAPNEGKGRLDRRSRIVEISWLHHGGDVVIAECALSFFHDENNVLTGVLGVCREIGSRMETLHALRQSESLFRMMYEQCPEGVIVMDNDTVIIDVNPQALELLGYTRLELCGKHYEDLLHPADLAMSASLLDMIEPGSILHRESRVRHKKGRFVAIDMSIKAIGDTHIQVIIRDVSNRKKIEAELITAKNVAESASKAKDMFVANISHEIRTPISGIIGMTDLVLKSKGLSAEQSEHLTMVKDAADSLLSIINDLLDFSKIQAGKLSLLPTDFFLRETLEKVVRSLNFRAQSKGIGLQLVVDHDVPDSVYGDPVRLCQIVRNLADNAIKFTEKGHVGIHVSYVGPLDDGLFIKFRVEDTGIGISEEHLPQLFQNFSQLEVAPEMIRQGTGLGLAICKRLSTMLGGTIWVESKVNEGSVFQFTVTLKKANFLHTEETKEPSEENVLRPEPLTILLAEDNAINRKFLLHFLEEDGHSVTTVNNGQEALEALRKSSFDIVLMDVRMPEMNGIEATAIIRSGTDKQINAEIPIVALTAYAMESEKQHFLQAGMNECITKPVSMTSLNRVMIDILQHSNNVTSIEPSILPSFEDSELFDAELFAERYQSHPELFKELAAEFSDSIPMTLARLEAAIADEDEDSVAKEAHSLANSAVPIGSNALHTFSNSMEKAARESRFDECSVLYAQIQHVCEVVLDQLAPFCETMS